MNTFEFEHYVNIHSLKPGDNDYNALGLAGEAGEVANVVKKITIRNTLPPEEVGSMTPMEEYKKNLEEELGDAAFYLARLALDNGLVLEDVFQAQILKLQDRSKEYGRIFKK